MEFFVLDKPLQNLFGANCSDADEMQLMPSTKSVGQVIFVFFFISWENSSPGISYFWWLGIKLLQALILICTNYYYCKQYVTKMILMAETRLIYPFTTSGFLKKVPLDARAFLGFSKIM